MKFKENIKKIIYGRIRDIKIEPIKTYFCLMIRYDMDDLLKEDLEFIMSNNLELFNKTSAFFLSHQIEKYGLMINKIRQAGTDIQLHSTARPKFIFFDNQKWFLKRYRVNLKKEREKFIDWKFSGHSPHGENNYLCFGNERDYMIIELAALNTGFKWVSSYRLIRDTANGIIVPNPIPVYNISTSKTNEKIVVFSPVWDDSFMRNSAFSESLISDNLQTIESAKKSIIQTLECCKSENIPFVLNIHPQNWIQRKIPVDKILLWLMKLCSEKNIDICSHQKMYEFITKNKQG